MPYAFALLRRSVAKDQPATNTFQNATVTVTVSAATVLYPFGSTSGDGVNPQGGLIQASDGNFYGTAVRGGAYDNGTVFTFNPTTGQETILHSFYGPVDGNHPLGTLIQATDGNLYGTTQFGGCGPAGTVFRIAPSGENFASIHCFQGPDGAQPQSGVIQGSDGNLYGRTYLGGPNAGGIAFKMDLNGNILAQHSFPASSGDGANPAASFVQGNDGNYYNTTLAGGASNLGTIFMMDSNAKVTILHSVSSSDGIGTLQQSPLVQGTDLSLYGEAFSSAGTGVKLCPRLHANSRLARPQDDGEKSWSVGTAVE